MSDTYVRELASIVGSATTVVRKAAFTLGKRGRSAVVPGPFGLPGDRILKKT
jgi:hypothetical protein